MGGWVLLLAVAKAQVPAAADAQAPLGLGTAGASLGDCWIRARVTEAPRAGLADEVREILGDGVVDIRVEDPAGRPSPPARHREGRHPRELFAAYLAEAGFDDPKVVGRFVELLDEAGRPVDELDLTIPAADVTEPAPTGTAARP